MKSISHYIEVLKDKNRVKKIINLRLNFYREMARNILYKRLPYRCYVAFYLPLHFYRVIGKIKKTHREDSTVFLAASPNIGAGKGHQIWNWVCGKIVADEFCVPFAYLPLPSKKWDEFMGMREADVFAPALKEAGYKFIRLPIFNANDAREKQVVGKIVKDYKKYGANTVLLLEQDQLVDEPDKAQKILQSVFWGSKARKEDELILNPENCNIGIHLRRGDILFTSQWLSERFQDNKFFANALNCVIAYVHSAADTKGKDIHIYLFGQGDMADFQEFVSFPNIHFCLDMDAKDSYIHMCYMDFLITSISQFSQEPGMINRGGLNSILLIMLLFTLQIKTG